MKNPKRFPCGECGQMVYPAERHTLEDCRKHQVANLPNRIKALAEIDGLCPVVRRHHLPDCAGRCGGTGRTALFKELRVKCVVGEHHDGYGEAWHGHYPDVHRDADCPGWVPEPDVEKACWQTLWALPPKWRIRALQKCDDAEPTEAVISAAEAWAKEQQKKAGGADTTLHDMSDTEYGTGLK